MHGRSFPLGATLYPEGVNFSVFSKGSESVQLLLFDHVDDPKPSRVDRAGSVDQPHLPLLARVCARYYCGTTLCLSRTAVLSTRSGDFDSTRTRCCSTHTGGALPGRPAYSRDAARKPGDNAASAMKSVVADLSAYDWEDDAPLRRPFTKTVVYELHVGGFTRHPNSGIDPARRGTYAGLIEKIPYLQDLGISAVELLPVFAFDEQDGPTGLGNYWGYSPISFFAPHGGYSSRRDPLGVPG